MKSSLTKILLAIGLVLGLILAIEWFFLYQSTGSLFSFRAIFNTIPVSTTSEISGVNFQIADNNLLQKYLKDFSYDKPSSVTLWGTRYQKVTVEKLNIILTDQVQEHDRYLDPNGAVSSSFGVNHNKGTITLHIQLSRNLLSAVDSQEVLNVNLLRRLYLLTHPTYNENKQQQEELKSIIEAYERSGNKLIKIVQPQSFSIISLLSSLFVKEVYAAGTCEGEYTCCRQSQTCSCSNSSFSCEGKSAGQSCGPPGSGATCSCPIVYNGCYERGCENKGTQTLCNSGSGACASAGDVIKPGGYNCTWIAPTAVPPPPTRTPTPACTRVNHTGFRQCGGSGSICGGNSNTSYAVTPYHLVCNGVNGSTQYSCSVGNACANGCDTATGQCKKADPVCPANTAIIGDCNVRCESCNAEGQPYDNSGNGCHGGGTSGFAQCECLKGNSQYCPQPTSTPGPAPTNPPNPTNPPSCGIAKPADCAGTWSCNGVACTANSQCSAGADWCYAGCCCSCSTISNPPPPSCTSTNLKCGGISVNRMQGTTATVLRSAYMTEMEGSYTSQILYIQPNEEVLFVGDEWTSGDGEYYNFYMRNDATGTVTNCAWHGAYNSGTAYQDGSGNCSTTSTVATGRWLSGIQFRKSFGASGVYTIRHESQVVCGGARTRNDIQNVANDDNRCIVKVCVGTATTSAPNWIRIRDGAQNITAQLTNNQEGYITDAKQQTITWAPITGAQSYSVSVNGYAASNTNGKATNCGNATEVAAGIDDCNNSVTGTTFNFTFQPGYNYEITVRAENTCAVQSTATRVYLAYNPKGGFETTSSCESLIGWACDLDTPTQPVTVNFIETDSTGDIPASPVVIATGTANQNVPSAALAQCGNAARAFQIDIPESFKDGAVHYIQGQVVNRSFGSTQDFSGTALSLDKCADPWIKMSRTAYVNPGATPKTNVIPKIVEEYDSGSDTNASVIMIGGNNSTAGSVMGMDIGEFNAVSDIPQYSANTNWHDGSTGKTYRRTQGTKVTDFLSYAKAKKNPKTITALSQITADGLYIYNGNLTITTNPPNYNFVLIVTGTVNLNMAGTYNSANRSVAILANTINFNATVTEANGIFIAENVSTGTSTSGLKINGNLIANTSFNFNRSYPNGQNPKPALFIDFSATPYMTLFPYLSQSIYDYGDRE